LRRGARKDCVQFAAYLRLVLCPSFSISGERCAYWGSVFALTSAANSLKLTSFNNRVPLRFTLSNDTNGLQNISRYSSGRTPRALTCVS
jgi:hypothetical protein